MSGKLIHTPTGKTYSYYSCGVYTSEITDLTMIWMKVRHGNQPSELVLLPWSEIEKID